MAIVSDERILPRLTMVYAISINRKNRQAFRLYANIATFIDISVVAQLTLTG